MAKPYGFNALTHVGARKGPITISKTQRDVHVTFEALAVLVVAPFSFWLASKRELEKWERNLALAIGISTLVVDGGLLLNYLRR